MLPRLDNISKWRFRNEKGVGRENFMCIVEFEKVKNREKK